MIRQICNNCGKPLRLLDKGHIFESKVVCPRCIKILDPQAVKPKVNYAKIAIEAIDRATEQTAEDRETNEDIRYERAKRRVVFFFSDFIWVIQLVLWLSLFILLPTLFLVFFVIMRLFNW